MKRIDLDLVDNKALGLYRMWNKKHPTRAFETTFNFPNEVGVLGNAMRIIYWSDKWQEDGEGDYYEHDFDSSPPVFCGSSEERVKNIDSILKVKNVNSTQSSWAILAEVCELSLRLLDGGVKTFRFKKPPLMLSTADRKGLCILYRKEPIFIRGGRMRVTERGIVN